MAEDDKIKYSDIIEPDDSIEKLVSQLSELNQQYSVMVTAIKAGADKIVHALKSASGATNEGRKSIDEATASTSRLERAQKELKLAVSDVGKQIAWLKAQTADTNRATVEQQRYLRQAVSSYDRLNSDLKQSVSLFKSLTAAERADSQMGQQLISDIINLKNQLKALDDQIKPHVQALTEVEKAEQKLAYLQSEEGQRLLGLKAKIAEVTSARRQQKASTDPLVQAQEKLAYAQSSENEQLKLYSTQIKEANRIAQLRVQIANSAEGSYNQLSAQYELNKIKLNQMSGAEREAVDVGKKLEAETNALYQQMIKLQEATGNYRLSVGHYQRTWDGLGISISNVVRELPAAAVSMNTFFLGISNNIPMVVDEINRLRAQNKAFRAEGKATVSVTGSIIKSLFSWNTALVVVLTALSMYGGKIIEWVGGLIKGKNAVISLDEALDNVAEELKTTNASFGSNVVSLKKLQEEWKNLQTAAEKKQWIIDNKSEFDKLGVAINDVTDAENVFIDNTEAVIGALKLRARAAAAQELASKKYEEALIARNKAETAISKDDGSHGFFTAAAAGAVASFSEDPSYYGGKNVEGLSFETKLHLRLSEIATAREKEAKALQEEAKAAEAAGDAYFDLAAGYENAAKEELKAAGIGEPHKKGPKGPKEKKSRERDLTDTVNRMAISVQKKYEESLTKLEREEFAKRRKEAVDTANAKIRELEETYRKSVDYLEDEENKYKELTDEEKRLVEETQQRIRETIINVQDQLTHELEQIEKDRQINELRLVEETIKLRLAAVKKGSAEELQLRLEAAQTAQRIALLENSKLPISQQQKPEDITAGFAKQQTTAVTQFDMEAFDQQQELDEAIFNQTKHNETEITRFKLEQEKERWQKQIDLAKAGSLDWSQTQIEAAEATIKGLDRELSELSFVNAIGEKGLGGALLEKLGFSDDQIEALGEAVNTTLGFLQEIAQAEVQLAEQAVEAAEKRVEAAQAAYDAEVEARSNGYANNAATAKRELQLEKKNQLEKEKLLKDAQKRQEALNSVIQASSLITASANLWSAFSSIPFVGPALALAAIAAMWTSFAVSKVKAKQVTASSQEYGEGGLEFLEGGSHASGNDIDLGTSNKKGKRMKAEGGEALAIINRRHTRKYRKILPSVIDSFNKGTFEDKYLKVFESGDVLQARINSSANVDLSKLEGDVNEIRRQNSTRYYPLADGTTLMVKGNVKRYIR